jgi:hypothetical protein
MVTQAQSMGWWPGRQKRTPASEEDWGEANLKGVDEAGLQEASEQLAAPGKPNVLPSLAPKLCDAVSSGVRDNGNFRKVGRPKGSRENEGPQAGIGSDALTHHDFVRAAPDERGIDGSKEGLWVVRRVPDHPIGTVAPVADEAV